MHEECELVLLNGDCFEKVGKKIQKECELKVVDSHYDRGCVPREQIYLETLTQTMYMVIHGCSNGAREYYNWSIIGIAPLFDPDDRSKALSYERYLEITKKAGQ